MPQIQGLKTSLKKILISFFILCFLWVSVDSHLSLFSHRAVPLYQNQTDTSFQGFLMLSATKFNTFLNQIGSILGVKNVWNMFAVIDRTRWSVVVYGMDQSGKTQPVQLPYTANTKTWQDNFWYREAKVFQVLYGNTFFQGAFAQNICKNNPLIKTVIFRGFYQAIPSPNETTTAKEQNWNSSYTCSVNR